MDESVARILTAKLKLYPKFELDEVLTEESGLSQLGTANAVTLLVNREAASLLSPSVEYLNVVLPQPPSLQEFITVFTDTRSAQQCSNCPLKSEFGNMDFKNTLIRYYGGTGTNQLNADRIHAYSFLQLTEILDQRTDPSDPYMADNLRRSQWVVLTSSKPIQTETSALKRILSSA